MEKRNAIYMCDEVYMQRAIELAKKGAGWTSPNPLVGAVIVKDGRVIGEGYHRKYGELHAERNAFANCSEDPCGATIYVTLEPCCHYGKTPPCTEIIIEKKIKRVVIGSRDPNPKVAGKGAALLRERGIEVCEDFLRDECDELNPIFFHYITTNMPYVCMKYAMTIDGKIATHTGASRWITGKAAREHVHGMRGRYAAIMVGIGTVLADDPMLNCRSGCTHQPIRIICDSKLNIPLDSRIVKSAKDYRTIIVCADIYETEKNIHEDSEGRYTKDSEKDFVKANSFKELEHKESVLLEKGVEIWKLDDGKGQVDLKALINKAGEEKIDSILVEGGGILHEACLKAGIVNHVCAYVAPKIFGGAEAKTPVEGPGVERPDESPKLELQKVTKLEEDILIEYEVTGGMKGVYRNC